MTRARFLRRWLLTSGAICAALVWLQRIGHGAFAGPAWSVDGIHAWLDRTDTVTAAFAIVRLLAIGVGVYLLVLTVLAGSARYFDLPAMTRVAERLTLPFARSALGGMALLGVL